MYRRKIPRKNFGGFSRSPMKYIRSENNDVGKMEEHSLSALHSTTGTGVGRRRCAADVKDQIVSGRWQVSRRGKDGSNPPPKQPDMRRDPYFHSSPASKTKWYGFGREGVAFGLRPSPTILATTRRKNNYSLNSTSC